MKQEDAFHPSMEAPAAGLLAQLPQLIWRERELSVARLASTLTHTLGTPLQVIAGRAALARKSADIEQVHKHLDIIQRKCGEITSLLWRVLDSLRGEPDRQLEPVEVARFVRECLEELARVAPHRKVSWDLQLDGSTTEFGALRICAADLRHALLSIGLNLLAQEPDGSEVLVTLSKVRQQVTSFTPVHDAILRLVFRRSRNVEEGPLTLDEAGTHSGDPWFHTPPGQQVDGGAIGWAAVYEIARNNEGQVETGSDSVTLSWPAVP